MAEINEVGVVNGVPATGTGEVPTLAPVRNALGIVTETAPATDTASSGLNGRLQRVAQRLTSLIAAIEALPTDGLTDTELRATAVSVSGPLTAAELTAADPATQTTLAAILAKLLAAPSTEAKQDTQVAHLAAIEAAVEGALPAGDNNIGNVDLASALPAGTNQIGHVGGTEYETVAASQTDQALGATGATGDYLAGVLIIPATTSPGAVSVKDGAGSAITIFTGGVSSVSNLVPFYVPLGAKSAAGAWSVATGANVSAVGFGDFT